MLFMVIERFVHGPEPVYARFAAEGRLAPEGLHYVSSWVDERLDRCFQIMECDDRALLEVWMSRWSDLVAFEVVSVLTSSEAASRVATLRESK